MSRKKRKLNKVGRKSRRVASAVAVCAISGMMFSGSASAQVTKTAADVLYRYETGIYTHTWQSSPAFFSGTDLLWPGNTFTYPSGHATSTGGSQVYTYDFSSGAINLSASLNSSFEQFVEFDEVLFHTAPPYNAYTDYNTGNVLVDTLTHSLINSYYAPYWYAVLNANDVIVPADGSGYAVKTDTGVGSTLNLTGTNQFNGTVQLGTTTDSGVRDGGAYLYSGTTTFNGSLNANLFMGNTNADYYGTGVGYGTATTSTAIFTTAATTITGNISESAPSVGDNVTRVEFQGNNTISGTVGVDNVYVSGSGVVFNGNVTADALTFSSLTAPAVGIAGSASFGDNVGMTGDVNYAGGNAILNLGKNSFVDGDIINTGTNNGTLNFLGGHNVVTGGVGTIGTINVGGNTAWVQLNTLGAPVNGTTTVGTLAINADKAVVEVGGLLTATSVTMGGHYSKLELRDRSSSAPGTEVGTPTTGAYTSLTSPATYEAKGMKGTLDFGIAAGGVQGKGTLEVGDGVNVKFTTDPTLGIKAVNANNATLVFAGSSSVGGYLGTSATSSNTFNRIWAGTSGNSPLVNTVTFQNDIYVGVNAATRMTAGSLSESDTYTGSLNVGGGTVNLNGDLHGNLVFGSGSGNAPVSVETSPYSGYGDGGVGGTWSNGGTVNIADSKTVSGTITTNFDNTGVLNFMGSSSYIGAIGASGKVLNAVTFNSASTGSATTGFTAAIDGNVYASTVTIGNSGSELKPVALSDITGDFDYAGATAMQGWTGGTVANIKSTVTQLGGALVLNNAHDAINFGTAHVTAASFTTHGGALSFTVNSLDQTGVDGAASTPNGSSLLTLTGALAMTGAEKVQVNYVGSLANGGTCTLIDAASGSGWTTSTDTDASPQVFDNSFSINSSVSQVSGDLIVTANRTGSGAYAANENYIQKSGTVGSFTNNAGIALGTIAAAGSQTGAMVEVIQKLDIDNFGYGNNQANLATQVRRLAPIANASITESAFSSFDLSLNAVDMRMSALRGKCVVPDGDTSKESSHDSGVWLKGLGSYGRQQQRGEYDGYASTVYGTAVGFDGCVNEDLLLGIAGGYTATDVDQKDFRYGDTMHIKSYQMMGYLNFDVTSAFYVDGAISYGLNNYDGSRTAALDRTAASNFDGTQFGADLGIGYGFKLGSKTTFTPQASVDYKQLQQDAYTETGAGAISLNVDGQSINRTRLGLGARLATEWANPGITFRPEVAFHWYHNIGTQSEESVASFVGGGSSFVTPGVALDSNAWNLSAAVTAATKGAFSLQLRYDLDSRTEFMAHTGSIIARIGF